MSHATRRIQQYEILGRIGRGGMATVYLAFDEDLGRQIALKELDLRDSESDLVARFMQESRMAAGLGHQNIITVFSRLEEDGVPYIAMEYLDHGSLRPHVGELTPPQIFGVLEGTLAGLDHAHRKGVVHRDLKPENLLITSEGTIKIADFGIAKAVTSATRGLTKRSAILGTPTYMAPEQVTNKPVGPATDLYSLGVISFELFCGRVPFEESDEPMAVLFRHVNEEPPPPASVCPGLDPRLSAWILSLLAKNPSERPQRAGDAWEELEDVIVSLEGATWRRQARLPTTVTDQAPASKPLTPAPFTEPTPPSTAPEPTPPPAAVRPKPPVEAKPPEAVPPPAEPAPRAEAQPPPAPRRPPKRAAWLRRLAPPVAAVAGLVLIGASFLPYFDDQSLWEEWTRADIVSTVLAAGLVLLAVVALRSQGNLAIAALAALAAVLYGWWCNHPFFDGAGVAAWIGMGAGLVAFGVTALAALALLPRRDAGRTLVLVVGLAAALAVASLFIEYIEGGGSIWNQDYKRGAWLAPPAAALIAAVAAFFAGGRLRLLAALLIGAFVAGNDLLVIEYPGNAIDLAGGFFVQVGSMVVAAIGVVVALVSFRAAKGR